MMSSRNQRLVRDAVRFTGRPRPTATWAASAAATALAATLALGGCASSPDSHYYTLTSGSTNAFAERQANGGAAAANAGATVGTDADASSSPPSDTASAASATGKPLLIEVLPVNVPNQVSRPQIVTTTGKGSVDIDDYNRWSSPLGDEIGTALSQILSRRLGAIDTYRTPRPAGATAYRITVNVQRFESIRGDRATIDAVWSVVRSSDSLTLTCRTSATEKIGGSLDDLAAGHRKALGRVAAQIAQGVRMERGVPAKADSDTSTMKPDTGKAKTDTSTSGSMPASVPLPTLSCPGTI